MIEAIRAALPDGAAQTVEQTPSAPPSVQASDPMLKDLAAAQYFSPVYRLDIDSQTLVLQYRDAWSGEVRRQIPSEKQLEAYKNGATPTAALVTRLPPPEPGERKSPEPRFEVRDQEVRAAAAEERRRAADQQRSDAPSRTSEQPRSRSVSA